MCTCVSHCVIVFSSIVFQVLRYIQKLNPSNYDYVRYTNDGHILFIHYNSNTLALTNDLQLLTTNNM